MSMDGARVVVTGTSRGIGQGVARLLCAEGASVVGLDVRDPAETAGLAGERFHPVAADVSEPADVERAFGEADELLGGSLHGLVCVAGIAPEMSFLETPPEVLDRYDRLTCRPELPPKWAFGTWISSGFRVDSQERVLARARLIATASPLFLGSRSSVASGMRLRTRSAVSSVEASSTTTTWKWR